MKEKELQLAAAKAEILYMRENIMKLRKIIDEQNKELNLIKGSKGFRLLEKLRKLMFWRR